MLVLVDKLVNLRYVTIKIFILLLWLETCRGGIGGISSSEDMTDKYAIKYQQQNVLQYKQYYHLITLMSLVRCQANDICVCK
jgi:hypothetical protein